MAVDIDRSRRKNTMAYNSKTHIYVVDDDSCIRDTVSLNLKKARLGCTCFENADDCLRQLQVQSCDLLITDVRMPGKDGIELLAEVGRLVPWLPVLVMTSYGDISLAVKAVKAGAINFVEKPLQWDNFLALIKSILKQNSLNDTLRGKRLTKTEKVILCLILQGRSNKETAHLLYRSVRTVEVHRSNIMHKLGVDNVVDLVKRAAAMGLDETK